MFPLSQMKIRQACDFYAHSVMTAVSSLKSRSLESEDKKPTLVIVNILPLTWQQISPPPVTGQSSWPSLTNRN